MPISYDTACKLHDRYQIIRFMDFETNKFMMAVFTDIDGTFISNDTFDPGKNFALAEELDRHNHFLVFNSSKTFHEIAFMQKKFKTKYPFICETGGGIYHPKRLGFEYDKKREDYFILSESIKIRRFRDLVRELIKNNFSHDFEFFDELNQFEKSKLTGLSGSDLAHASDRDFSILIKHSGNKTSFKKLNEALNLHNLNMIQGGRFCHVCSNNNKGKATNYFLKHIMRANEDMKIISVAIGDSMNDLDMLNAVDYPCIVKSDNNHNLLDKVKNKNVVCSSSNAPHGWVECVEIVFNRIKNQEYTHV